MLAAAISTACIVTGTEAGSAVASPIARPNSSARLTAPLRARQHPVASAQSVRYLSEFTPLTGQPALLPIMEARAVDGKLWYRVMLPGRPNNRTGWIPSTAAEKVPLTWRIRIDVGNRALAVFHKGELQKRLRVVVGKTSTPTPRGRFFVVEKVRLGTTWSPRGWALALSAYSDALRHFEGGQGQVAIHAKGSLLGDLGSASSHGCVRVADRDAGWLAAHVPRGAFVEIVS